MESRKQKLFGKRRTWRIASCRESDTEDEENGEGDREAVCKRRRKNREGDGKKKAERKRPSEDMCDSETEEDWREDKRMRKEDQMEREKKGSEEMREQGGEKVATSRKRKRRMRISLDEEEEEPKSKNKKKISIPNHISFYTASFLKKLKTKTPRGRKS